MNENEMLKELEKAPYDFVANNYWRMEKSQLKDIILEILAQFDGVEYDNLKKELVKNLFEFREWGEE